MRRFYSGIHPIGRRLCRKSLCKSGSGSFSGQFPAKPSPSGKRLLAHPADYLPDACNPPAISESGIGESDIESSVACEVARCVLKVA